MDAKEITADVKNEVSKNLEKLATLRDEAKLHIHLATLDAKQEWAEKLEPRINELQDTAHQLSETSKEKVYDVVKTVEDFVARLRNKPAASRHVRSTFPTRVRPVTRTSRAARLARRAERETSDASVGTRGHGR
jgi:cob(I)alamin adenosyltransferase